MAIRRAKDKDEQKIETEKRMVRVGAMALVPSHPLLHLRALWIGCANEMARGAFCQEPLLETGYAAQIAATCRAFEREPVGLNKGYVQKVRDQVIDALVEQSKRYFKGLVGRLRFCDAANERAKRLSKKALKRWDSLPETQRRKYHNVPEAVEKQVSEADFAGLRAIAEQKKGSELFRALLRNEMEPFGLNPIQVAIAREIHRICQERHNLPVWNDVGEKGADGFVAQIFLDYRNILGCPERNTAALAEAAMRQALETGATQEMTVSISHPKPKEPAIPLRLRLMPKVIERLNKDQAASVACLAVEIGPSRIDLKAVLKKPAPLGDATARAAAIDAIEYIIGRDYGYRTTVAHTVLKLPRPIDRAQIAEIQALAVRGKDEELDEVKARVKAWLEARHLPQPEIVAQTVWSGKDFLAAVNRHAQRAARLSTQIDGIYEKIACLKDLLIKGLRRNSTDQIPREEIPEDPYLAGIHGKFFRLLDIAHHLKSLRKQCFRAADGIKKSWLGFLANTERALATKWGAAVAREDLTVAPTESLDADYKGPWFGRMLNNGAKGKYIRAASEKLAWFGIPELVLPSFWTSSYCVEHGIVDGAMRDKDVFTCPKCPEPRHADSNAGLTLAAYPVLVPQQTT